MYGTILVPTDGSDASLEAFDHALEIAAADDATLHVLYVVDTGYPYGDLDGAAIEWESVVDALHEEGRRTLATFEERADAAGVSVVGEVREGSRIHRTILEYADDVGAELVVMGTHGRRGLGRWLLGSVTEQVVRTAPIPVLTVRADEPED